VGPPLPCLLLAIKPVIVHHGLMDRTVEYPNDCPTCQGTGVSLLPCSLCHGFGHIEDHSCWVCEGKGKEPCATCATRPTVQTVPSGPTEVETETNEGEVVVSLAPKGDYVLVIEDDLHTSITLCDLLEAEGYRAVWAPDGSTALRCLERSSRPCLILLDLLTTPMNGWQFRQAQRQNPALTTIPTVVVSAVPITLEAARGLEADGYLAKPYDVRVLLSTVGQYCPKSEATMHPRN
jgi:CheY-like chemotaxis protein